MAIQNHINPTKIIQILLLVFNLQLITYQQQPLQEKLLQLEDDIENQQQNCKDCKYYQRITELIHSPQIQQNRTAFAKSLYLYGKMLYFSLTPEENSLKKSFYFFKLAQTYGSQESLYFLSLFQNFQLDGSFNALTHLETNPEFLTKNHKNITQNHIKKLVTYLNDKRFSEMVTNLYFSGIQGNQEALIGMGYRYSKGIGVDTNCSSSALYYEQVANNIFLENNMIPKVTYKKRLDHNMYNIKQGVFDIFYEEDKLQILENVNFENFQRENLQEMFNLGRYYFHGLGGLKRDYKKAFEIINNLNKENRHSYLQKMLGEMYMSGLGVKQNYKKAKDLYLEAAFHNDTGAFNGLGYLYMNGFGVDKNLKKAVEYFQKSALLGDSEGMYNYGSLLLMPSTPELQRNFQLGHHFLTKAAELNHAQAQYALALLYLDGVDYFQNCETAVNLLRNAVMKGPWAEHMKNGNTFFQKRNYRAAFLNFLQSAMMGEDIGYLNSAILADKFEILTDEDTNYDKLQESLDNDSIYLYLKSQKKLKYNNLNYFLYSDYLKLLKDIEIDERYEILNDLIRNPVETNRTMNRYIAFKCYSLTMADFPYSALRLGDFAYYGIYQQKNFKQAYDHYQIAIRLTTQGNQQQNDTIASQGYYNLGYMTLFGEGTERNITNSYKLFQKSIEANPVLYQYQKVFYFFIQFQNYYENFQFEEFKGKAYEKVGELFAHFHLYFKASLVMFLVFFILFLWITSLRIKNKHHMDLKHEIENLEIGNL